MREECIGDEGGRALVMREESIGDEGGVHW